MNWDMDSVSSKAGRARGVVTAHTRAVEMDAANNAGRTGGNPAGQTATADLRTPPKKPDKEKENAK